ncbi:MAG: DUF4159 domain-containing protein [Saprospiraceae bacterium]|jgi:hypothetical protein|nr:DUF4159 domain-containing protein [Saprospiraceae bacterium]
MNRLIFVLFPFLLISATAPSLKIGLLKYGGGGDWYSNPTSLVNLAGFCNKFLGTNIDPEYAVVDAGSVDLFNYPLVHMTGHGNVVFSDADAENLRNYLIAGGFLHIDDNYGIDPFVRVAMKKVFPELSFVELPFNHPIYHQKYKFDNGLPKIHKHDDKPAQGFGLIWEGRLICYYSYESDLGDGWEDPEVHKDAEEVRIKALKMGANIVQYVFGY